MDSPALNAHSRAVLVPLPRPQLPTSINIPGPGPTEPHIAPPEPAAPIPTVVPETKPSPPIPSASNGVDATQSESDDAEDEPVGANDPYSNLEGAFGNYLADEPRPMASVNHRTRHGDEDDLLF
jgi:AP-2 complex subunit beta-1